MSSFNVSSKNRNHQRRWSEYRNRGLKFIEKTSQLSVKIFIRHSLARRSYFWMKSSFTTGCQSCKKKDAFIIFFNCFFYKRPNVWNLCTVQIILNTRMYSTAFEITETQKAFKWWTHLLTYQDWSHFTPVFLEMDAWAPLISLPIQVYDSYSNCR